MMLAIAVYLSLYNHPPVIAYFFSSTAEAKPEPSVNKKDSVKIIPVLQKDPLPAKNFIDKTAEDTDSF